MTKLSAILIVKNGAKHIEKCLDALDFVDEIIVLDSGSSDGTQEILKKYKKVTLEETDWPGFGPQKNRALAKAKGEWVLSLDVDEIITDKLREEILEAIKSSDKDVDGFEIPRLNIYFGKEPRFKKPNIDFVLRLFKREKAKFSDDLVHEKVLVKGKAKKLNNYFLHNTLSDLEEMMNKANFYSSLGAKKLIARNEKVSLFSAFFHAYVAFIRIYFGKAAILDGVNGFLLAYGNWLGTFLKYAKAREKLRS